MKLEILPVVIFFSTISSASEEILLLGGDWGEKGFEDL